MSRKIEIWTKESGKGFYTINSLPLGECYHRENGPAFIEYYHNKSVEKYFWNAILVSKDEHEKLKIVSKFELI